MTSRTAVKTLLVLALGLPVLLAVFGWVVGLLTAMGDDSAALVLKYLTTSVSTLWLATVVGLVIALALESLEGSDHGPPSDLDEP